MTSCEGNGSDIRIQHTTTYIETLYHMPVTRNTVDQWTKYDGFEGKYPHPPIYREYLRIGASRMKAVYTIR